MNFNKLNKGTNLEKLMALLIGLYMALLLSGIPNERKLYIEYFAGHDGRIQESELQEAVDLARKIGAKPVLRWLEKQNK